MASLPVGKRAIFLLFLAFVVVVGGAFLLIGALNGGDSDTGDENQSPPASSPGP